MNRKILIGLGLSTAVIVCLTAGGAFIQRKLLYHPSHYPPEGRVALWTHEGTVLGCSREVPSPQNVWLMLHGNAGQASSRDYALPSFSAGDSVFILEYPGYGDHKGAPSKAAFNQAAREAYQLLRSQHPKIPVCVAGESIGTGPSSFLAGLENPPDKLVLIVPFERLSLVARDHFPSFLVSLLLKDDWDNRAALARYKGPVDVFAAEEDEVIPVRHAKALAAAVPQARLVLIPGGHNDWSQPGRVAIRNP